MATLRAPTLKDALRLADEIVASQGNIFIRELLRAHRLPGNDVRIGTTKPTVIANVHDALRSGAISPDTLIAWLDDIEGWGQQHVYLYRLPAPFAETAWTPSAVARRVAAAGFTDQWQAPAGHRFPESLHLQTVAFDGIEFQLVWHQAQARWERDPTQDKPPERIDGDDYEFRAYRHARQRAVARFVLRPGARRAALLVPHELGPDHTGVVAAAHNTLRQIFPHMPTLHPVLIARAIQALETHALNHPGTAGTLGDAEPRDTTFSTSAASVHFQARRNSYMDDALVRRARIAVRPEEFASASSKVQLRLEATAGLRRTVIMSLHGGDRRVYFFARMTAAEVWRELDHIFASCG